MFLLEAAAHATLLHLPYYWDEAGYYIPAAYDFFRTGTLVPYSTLTNAHPPGLSLYLAAAWKLFGFAPLTTRLAMCAAAALALIAVYRLTLAAVRSRAVACAVTLLTALYPVWFAQSTLAHADLPAAAATLWGLSLTWAGRNDRRTLLAMTACYSVAALTKEIAIGTPLALAAWELARLVRRREPGAWPRVASLCAPVLPLALWFGYHRWRTGFTFGNPEYLHYNATTTLLPARVLLALAHRVLHLAAHLNLFVPVAIALGSLVLVPLAERRRLRPELRAQLWVVIVANALLFSALGGALLTRYLLPVYPLVLLLAVEAVWARFRGWVWFAVLSAAAFVAGLVLPPPYRVAPEDTLAYRDAVELEQQAIGVVASRFPHSTTLSAWPVTDALRKPELGYVRSPLPVVAIDNFSLGELQKLGNAAQSSAQAPVESWTTAIVFSTKYEPGGMRLPFAGWRERQEEHYFALHHDLSPAAVAALLGGTVVWQAQRGAQYAAVLRFTHPQLAGSYNQGRAVAPGAACEE